jgi:hypothetical protein
MTMHQKVNVLIIFNISPKRAFLKKEKKKSLIILLYSLGLYLPLLLVKFVEDVAIYFL